MVGIRIILLLMISSSHLKNTCSSSREKMSRKKTWIFQPPTAPTTWNHQQNFQSKHKSIIFHNPMGHCNYHLCHCKYHFRQCNCNYIVVTEGPNPMEKMYHAFAVIYLHQFCCCRWISLVKWKFGSKTPRNWQMENVCSKTFGIKKHRFDCHHDFSLEKVGVKFCKVKLISVNPWPFKCLSSLKRHFVMQPIKLLKMGTHLPTFRQWLSPPTILPMCPEPPESCRHFIWWILLRGFFCP